ncbi:hypothetical protein [Porcipelethomonas sp.]|uniref:hypothetical protein n=1 Tax=Porcipelethomonas sp. TaxID=2981675 RepID=UPI003EF9ED78
MNRIKKMYQNLNKMQKIQVVLASVITLIFLAEILVYAWFALSSNKAETMTKVQEPKNLDIRAGNAESIEYFDLNDINIEEITADSPKCYVFCVVTGSSKTLYDLQIAHTTNIPFTYTLYRAEVGTEEDANTVPYITHDSTPETIYYKRVGEELKLTSLNDDKDNIENYGRKLGEKNDKYYDLVYNADDSPEIYAVAKYEQVTELETKDPDHDFYILELGVETDNSATGFLKWNSNENNKETDIIYITANRTTR